MRPDLKKQTFLYTVLVVVCQILYLNEHGLDSVAKHMGQDLFVHRKYSEASKRSDRISESFKAPNYDGQWKSSRVSWVLNDK